MMRRILIALLISGVVGVSAFADGVTDILPTGGTSFYITTSGSYRLAGNVTMTADLSCIVPVAPNVQLDLNGHTIDAGGVAVGGSSYGIYASVPGVSVSNGTIKGFGAAGVNLLGANASVEGVSALGNNSAGYTGGILTTGDYAKVVNCVATGNSPAIGGTIGISVGKGGRVEGCRANENSSGSTSGFGINATSDAIIQNNVCIANSSGGAGYSCAGISTGDNCVIERNVCTGNMCTASQGFGNASGINAGSRCTIRGNTANGNTNSSEGNGIGIYSPGYGSVIEANACAQNREGVGDGSSIGIWVSGQGCRVVGNTCSSNAGFGASGSGCGILATGSGALIEGNNCSLNAGIGAGKSSGIQASANFLRIVGNVCFGQTGGATADGILGTSSNCLIAENQCVGNLSSPIRIDSAFGGNRIESNRISGSIVQIGGGNTIGAGDFANQSL